MNHSSHRPKSPLALSERMRTLWGKGLGVRGFLLLSLLLFASCQKIASSLPRLSSPLDASVVASFDSLFPAVNSVSAADLHSLMVVQDGKVIYERYNSDFGPSSLNICWSATKSFTAIAAGFAIQDGLLSLDLRVVDILPDLLPDSLPSDSDALFLQSLTLGDLLRMASGFRPDSITDRIRGGETFDPARTILSRGFRWAPGTRWAYNNSDTYIASLMVARAAGMSLADYLNARLFTPLGITDYVYESDSEGRNPGGFGLHLTTESLAKTGLFVLQKGEWEGRQLLDSAWVTRMTSVQIMQPGGPLDTDWRSGYCYQLWACKHPGCVRFDGMWGQYVIIMPDKNAVAVMTTICSDREAQMNAFWHFVYDKL